MADKMILEIKVDIHGKEVSGLKGNGLEVVMIPFGGTAEGEIFNGKVCPGGVDCQTVNLVGIRHMCAKYMLEGTDYTGEKCHIFIENNGYFDGFKSPFQTVPTFITDSKALAPYLHQNKFRGEGHPREGGVSIRLFEVGAAE